MGRSSIGVAGLWLALPGVLWAQSSRSAPSPPTFSSHVDLVSLQVTVTGGDRKPVTGLEASDFEVFDGRESREILFFDGGASPIDLALLVDGSTSLRHKVRTVRDAARGFIRTLRPGDRASVVGFNESVRTIQDWTGDHDALVEAVGAVRPAGGTSLFTAVYVALRSFPVPPDDAPRRRAIVILSDGDDTASLVSFEDVLTEVQRTGVAIYTVTLKKRNDPFEPVRLAARPSEFVMRRLAERSGGRALAIDTLDELSGAYAAIAAEIANLYLIAFEPAEGGEAFRQVTLRLPRHPGTTVRTRPGYFAGKPTT